MPDDTLNIAAPTSRSGDLMRRYPLGRRALRVEPRRQQIFKPDAAEHLGAGTVGDAVDDLGAVLRRVDVDAERPCAEGCRSRRQW